MQDSPCMLFRNGEDACLDRSEPQREIAHELTSSQMRRLGHGQTSLTATLDLLSVFDEDAQEAFGGTHGCAVKHNRDVLLVVLTHIFSTKALRQVEVNLDSTALPITAEGILQGEFKLDADGVRCCPRSCRNASISSRRSVCKLFGP